MFCAPTSCLFNPKAQGVISRNLCCLPHVQNHLPSSDTLRPQAIRLCFFCMRSFDCSFRLISDALGVSQRHLFRWQRTPLLAGHAIIL